MLAAIADLYLTSHVLILLDNTYMARFWTQFEAVRARASLGGSLSAHLNSS